MRTMDSDSDDDSDYVPPPAKDNGSDVSDSEGPAPKRARTDAPTDGGIRTGEDAYAAFKASLTAVPSESAQALPAPPETVKILKRYRFAGEEITEVKEVPADSEEAKKWPRWQPRDDEAGTAPSQDPPGSTSTASGTSSVAATPTSGVSNATPAKPPGKRPGPRKGKSKLADVPTKKEPVKRLTTLDKSAMDWRAHVEGESSTGMKDELEANRRGGGYLEKVEFLQRVEARKEDVLDAAKGKRRR
ncbi:bucentaur or craniofacial development-domain-containing protein [Earliella scabrosa]|nr:bucentaur or craniofacial development-domain-containing protein [Earliella scabrosa]